MTAFRFNAVKPHPMLSPYIAKMYVFESSGWLPDEDTKLIVPNGNFKLSLTCRNGIVANIGSRSFIQTENELSLTGLIDSPVMLNPQKDARTATIIIEFKPVGAYRFFHLSYTQVKNQIVLLSDLIGNRVTELKARLAEAGSLQLKSELLQQFLIRQMEKTAEDPIYDYCINRISDSKGLLTVAQLEKETGYSSRWLNMKFSEHLGTGPKNLSEIVRFKQFYEVFSTGAHMHSLKNEIYQYYHDQSHFIRAFKRFTGFTPGILQNCSNELATRHYQS